MVINILPKCYIKIPQWQLTFTEHPNKIISKLINPISNCTYPGNLSIYKRKFFFEGFLIIQYIIMEFLKALCTAW